MNIPKEIKDRIVQAIADLKVSLENNPSAITVTSAVRYEALPLWSNFGGTVCLRPSGELIRLGWGDKGPASTVDPINEIPVLLEGLAAYPWLSALLPVRSKQDVDCVSCRGAGKLRAQGRNSMLHCPTCDGLGWTQLTSNSNNDAPKDGARFS